mmetsp:Transcript_1182/g.3653  ORF Transcript_1182/g.3653 Transcript_1182/m.3653 type:complete len:248 (+) Transcript_1182:166-909(+)
MASSSLSSSLPPPPALELPPAGRDFLPFSIASSSSTLLPDSSCLKRSSRLPGVLDSGSMPCETSALVSSISTFSFILSKAPAPLLEPTSPSISFTCAVVLAVRARAMSCSFSSLALWIFSSRDFTASKSLSTFVAMPVSCCPRSLAFVAAACLRVRASLASTSSPFSTASSARRYHSPAISSCWSFCVWRRRWVASTSAYEVLTLMRSPCISSTAWARTFSGSSTDESTWLMLDLTTRVKRSNRLSA